MADHHDPSDAIGHVSHYYSHLSVAAVSLTGTIRVGERIHIIGHTTNEVQTVESLEIDRAKVEGAGPGDDVALHVNEHVRDNDLIFREEAGS